MAIKEKFGFVNLGRTALLAAMMVFTVILIAGADVQAGEGDPGNQKFLSSLDLPQRPLSLIKHSPVVAAGVTLGTAVIYDDPTTRRPADYLEIYDSEGGLVIVSWFDRFGIQRMAMDRGFATGEKQLAGVFVAVVDGNFI